jgi:hypothetical protein
LGYQRIQASRSSRVPVGAPTIRRVLGRPYRTELDDLRAVTHAAYGAGRRKYSASVLLMVLSAAGLVVAARPGGLAGVAGLASGKVDVIVNHRRIGSSHKDGSPDDKIQTAGPSLISA